MYTYTPVLVFVIPILIRTDGVNGLICYKCHYHPDDNTCVDNPTMAHNETCPTSASFCRVDRLETGHKLNRLKRECAEACQAGCTGAEGYIKCESCCSTDLCNTDNGTPSTLFSLSAHLLLSSTCLSVWIPIFVL